MKITKKKLRKIIREEIKHVVESTIGKLNKDQSDRLEAIVLQNKRKSNKYILKIVKNDSLFRNIKISDVDLEKYIDDVKMIFT